MFPSTAMSCPGTSHTHPLYLDTKQPSPDYQAYTCCSKWQSHFSKIVNGILLVVRASLSTTHQPTSLLPWKTSLLVCSSDCTSLHGDVLSPGIPIVYSVFHLSSVYSYIQFLHKAFPDYSFKIYNPGPFCNLHYAIGMVAIFFVIYTLIVLVIFSC